MIAGFNIKTIDDAVIQNKRVIIRVDFNVSLYNEGQITDDTRIRQAIPTIKKLLQQQNKLILISHLGRPKGIDPKYSLRPIIDRLTSFVSGYTVKLMTDFESDNKQHIIADQKKNEIILLENIRFFKGEKENDSGFAKKLARMADIYVDDAFGSVHRSHASIVGIANYIPGYAGLLLQKEIEMLSKITKNPQRPLIAILAGAKISTKIGLISRFMKIADYILLGGGIANTLLQVQGYQVGKSLVESTANEAAKQVLASVENSPCKLILPLDAVCGNLQDPNIKPEVHPIAEIPSNLAIYDLGPATEIEFDKVIKQGKTIVWNGPVGLFENQLYRHCTDTIYDSIISTENAVTIIGGGDTLVAISDKKSNDKITHISTGGGAMLEFIEKGTLPGIDALTVSASGLGSDRNH